MAASTDQLIALSNDGQFARRIRVLVLEICAQVRGEDVNTPNHAGRVNFANGIIKSPGSADGLAQVLVTRTNLLQSTISYNFANQAVVTDASDAAILSQIATDWEFLAGI